MFIELQQYQETIRPTFVHLWSFSATKQIYIKKNQIKNEKLTFSSSSKPSSCHQWHASCASNHEKSLSVHTEILEISITKMPLLKLKQYHVEKKN